MILVRSAPPGTKFKAVIVASLGEQPSLLT